MGAAPDPAALYPDIAAEGGQAAALHAVAAENGIRVPFQTSDANPLGRAAVATTVAHRTVLSIDARAQERRWSIRGCETFRRAAEAAPAVPLHQSLDAEILHEHPS